ncbi:unnamed protein product [Pocillopora meandrina]|uniref:Uncharacterized protein n=1 Tax=Pocillopora meandrina TaxID=46732 RepID=A0AAU9WZZ3_9CNID|nr:unnamed protein product [Pocillopora meandrina]
MEPGVKELFLRNDNAGCYHKAALLSSAAVIITRQGLVLKDQSFSEANSGKDVCDRKIAPLKAHVDRYVNEGKIATLIHDVTTAVQLKEAFDSYGGSTKQSKC